MSTQSPSNPKSRQSPGVTSYNTRNFLWIGIGIAAVAFIAIAIIVWRNTSFPFEFVGGEEAALVILRNPKDAEYQIKFTGNSPADLQRVLIQLESPDRVLHVDVQQVVVVTGDQEVVLDTSGKPPEGTKLTLQPGEVFTIRVTYYGDTIGAHYVYGFRLGYDANGTYNENALNIKDRKFIVTVE